MYSNMNYTRMLKTMTIQYMYIVQFVPKCDMMLLCYMIYDYFQDSFIFHIVSKICV